MTGMEGSEIGRFCQVWTKYENKSEKIDENKVWNKYGKSMKNH